MSYRNFNRFMFKLVSKILPLPIRHHLTKITLQLVHKTVLHWLPLILSPFPNPFLTSVLCRHSCDLLQDLSDCHPLFSYLSHNSHFPFILASMSWQLTSFFSSSWCCNMLEIYMSAVNENLLFLRLQQRKFWFFLVILTSYTPCLPWIRKKFLHMNTSMIA